MKVVRRGRAVLAERAVRRVSEQAVAAASPNVSIARSVERRAIMRRLTDLAGRQATNSARLGKVHAAHALTNTQRFIGDVLAGLDAAQPSDSEQLLRLLDSETALDELGAYLSIVVGASDEDRRAILLDNPQVKGTGRPDEAWSELQEQLTIREKLEEVRMIGGQFVGQEKDGLRSEIERFCDLMLLAMTKAEHSEQRQKLIRAIESRREQLRGSAASAA